jgi:hypothetical protein
VGVPVSRVSIERAAELLLPGDMMRYGQDVWRCGTVAVSPDAVTVELQPTLAAAGAAPRTLTLTPGEMVRIPAEPLAAAPRFPPHR